MSNDDDGWLMALYTMGMILLVTPALLGLLLFLPITLIRGSFGVDAGIYAPLSTMTSGLIAVVYATVKMRRKKKRL